MFSPLDKAVICRLQDDLPLVPQPYKIMADELGITEEGLLNKVRELYDKGIIRRFGAVLRHRKAGFKANVMVVWIVPEDRTGEVGKIMASFPQVSHCYQRSTFPGWPYNVFTMIHGQTTGECEAIIAEIVKAVEISSYELLYSTHELKKNSMKYFDKY